MQINCEVWFLFKKTAVTNIRFFYQHKKRILKLKIQIKNIQERYYKTLEEEPCLKYIKNIELGIIFDTGKYLGTETK